MPFLYFLLAGTGLTAFKYYQENKDGSNVGHPAGTGQSQTLEPISITTIAGYAIAGGVIIYIAGKVLNK